jgi:hypothetical protein
MRIVMEADDRTGLEQGDKIERTEIVLSELGSEGWVRMEVGGRTYDIDYRERGAVCLHRRGRIATKGQPCE